MKTVGSKGICQIPGRGLGLLHYVCVPIGSEQIRGDIVLGVCVRIAADGGTGLLGLAAGRGRVQMPRLQTGEAGLRRSGEMRCSE